MEIYTFFTPCTDLLVLMLHYFNSIAIDFELSFYRPSSESTIKIQNLSASLHLNVISTTFYARLLWVWHHFITLWCWQNKDNKDGWKMSRFDVCRLKNFLQDRCYTCSTLLCWDQNNNETLWQRQQMFNFGIFNECGKIYIIKSRIIRENFGKAFI